MLTDQTRRELLEKLGLGAAALVAAWPARAFAGKPLDTTEPTCKPVILNADPARGIDVAGGAPGQSFTFRLRATTKGFLIDNSQIVSALDPASLGISRDRRSLDLGMAVGSGSSVLVGLDSILADSNPSRCQLKGITFAADISNPATLTKDQFLKF